MNFANVSGAIISSWSILWVSLLVSGGIAAAADSEMKLLEPAALSKFRDISELEYSSERQALLFVVSEAAKVSGGIQTVWHFDLQAGEARQLSARRKINTQARWCPHSNCLTFISDRGGKRQIYRLSMAGGEAEKVSDRKTDISAYEWSPTKNTLAYREAPAKASIPELSAYSLRTNENGRATFKITKKDKWYIQMIHMQKIDEEDADYESNWSTITFEIK